MVATGHHNHTSMFVDVSKALPCDDPKYQIGGQGKRFHKRNCRRLLKEQIK